LLIPLPHPSAAVLQHVLEGCVALREIRDREREAAAGANNNQQQQQQAAASPTAYVQGMSYLAEVLSCYMPPASAIESLCALFEQSPFFRAYLAMRVDDITARFTVFDLTLQLNAPMLFQHLKALAVPPDCYYLEYVATLTSCQLSGLDECGTDFF
jgi:hypothetical protein